MSSRLLNESPRLFALHPDDTQQFSINTLDATLWQKNNLAGDILPLFSADYESVCMMRWPAGAQLNNLEFPGGVEYFILEGSFSDQQASYTAGSWLRLPANSTQTINVLEDCLLLQKSGHLKEPVSYV